MDDALVQNWEVESELVKAVLILVLMDDALVQKLKSFLFLFIAS